MARMIRLNLTGESERLVEKLQAEGMSSDDIFSKALQLLELASNGNLGTADPNTGQIREFIALSDKSAARMRSGTFTEVK